MEQEYFYLTITDNNDKYNAHQLKETLDIHRLQAWNKGDIADDNPNIRFTKTVLMYSAKGYSEDYIFYASTMSAWRSLPHDLQKTLHFVTNTTTERQCHGCYLSEDKIKSLAVINADFKFHAKLYSLSKQHDYPFSEYINLAELAKTDDFELSIFLNIFSFKYKRHEIAEKIGLQANGGFDYDELRRGTNKPFGRTFFRYGKTCKDFDRTTQHIEQFINELYQVKNNILALGNEIDISYSLSITGRMPDEYDLIISADSIYKMAEMRLPLDFDMYFKNNY